MHFVIELRRHLPPRLIDNARYFGGSKLFGELEQAGDTIVAQLLLFQQEMDVARPQGREWACNWLSFMVQEDTQRRRRQEPVHMKVPRRDAFENENRLGV